MEYPNISPAPFTNLVAFKRICLACSKRLVEGTQTPQYLAFTSVSQESLDEIDRTREERRGWLPRMTILYDGREEILIVKLMVGVMHEGVAHQFASMFEAKLFLLDVRASLLATGSGRFGAMEVDQRKQILVINPILVQWKTTGQVLFLKLVCQSHLLCCVEMLPFGSPTVMGELA
jgi:hypothetical protein